MEIAYWDIADAGGLFQVYNEQFAGVPHCYPVSREEFEKGFPYRNVGYDYHIGDYRERIHSEKLIVGMQNGRILGFADVAVAEYEEEGQKKVTGFIRFLTYQTGRRHIGQALLEECEKYLTDLGMKQIKAFRVDLRFDHSGYHFYHVGYGMISDQMGHICALFGMNGYEKNGGEIFMNWPEYSVAEPEPPDKDAQVIMAWGPPVNAALPGLDVKALRDGKQIGVCESTSVGEFCLAGEAQDWLFIEGLFVEEEEQGKGWGRFLLQRNLWEMRRAGYRNAAISTDWRNYRAQLFYMNYGYQIADTNYEFVRNI